MPVLEWREAARADLLALVDYISDDNPDAAQRLKDDIEAKAEKLPERPKLYRAGRVPGTREIQIGMLNSLALTNATLAFNPKGDFGERHLHTLPYRMMPAYDSGNGDHRKIGVLAKDIAVLAEGHCTTDPYLSDPAKALTARRRKLRTLLDASPLLAQLETLAQSALAGTSTALSDGSSSRTQAPSC